MLRPRMIVAGRVPDGTSAVVAEGAVEATAVAKFPGVEFFLTWGTPDGIVRLSDEAGNDPTVLPFFAGPGGTRLLFARYAPEASIPAVTGDPAVLDAEVAEKLPGLAEVFADEGSAMHSTDTIDYGVCLEGELVLVLDGEELHVTPGTVVVQLGARHAWHNRSDAPALMCFVGIGAEGRP